MVSVLLNGDHGCPWWNWWLVLSVEEPCTEWIKCWWREKRGGGWHHVSTDKILWVDCLWLCITVYIDSDCVQLRHFVSENSKTNILCDFTCCGCTCPRRPLRYPDWGHALETQVVCGCEVVRAKPHIQNKKSRSSRCLNLSSQHISTRLLNISYTSCILGWTWRWDKSQAERGCSTSHQEAYDVFSVIAMTLQKIQRSQCKNPSVGQWWQLDTITASWESSVSQLSWLPLSPPGLTESISPGPRASCLEGWGQLCFAPQCRKSWGIIRRLPFRCYKVRCWSVFLKWRSMGLWVISHHFTSTISSR